MRVRLGAVELVLGGCAALLVFWSVWSVPYLPSNDGPQHAFVAYVTNHYEEASKGWQHFYTLNSPQTSNGYKEIVTRLEPWLGLERAHQLFIGGTLLVWSFGWFLWLRRRLGPGSFIPLVAFAASLQWMLWIGLYPFFLASALIPFALLVGEAKAVKPSPIVAKVALLASLLLLTAYIHVFAAVMLGGLLVAIQFVVDRRCSGLAMLAVAGGPSALYVLHFSSQSKMISEATGTAWEVPLNPLHLLFEYVLPGPAGMQVLMLALVFVALMGIRGERRGFGALGLLVISVGVVLPADWSGWELVRPRVMPTGFMIMLGAFPVQRVVLQRFAAFAVLVLVGWRGLWAQQVNQRTYDEILPQMTAPRGLDLSRDSWVYLTTVGPVPSAMDVMADASSVLHLGQIVAPAVGGAPMFSHTGEPTLHHVLVRQEHHKRWMGPVHPPTWSASLWSPSLGRRQRDLAIFSHVAEFTWLDALVLYGLPGDGETLAEAGYAVTLHHADVASGESLFVGRFAGCTWEVLIDAPLQPATVSFGFGNNFVVRESMIVSTDVPTLLDGMPCGPAWLDVDLGCVEERQPNGVVPLWARDGYQRVVCTVPGANQ